MDTPIACTLGPADYRARRATIDDLTRSALRSRSVIDDGARLTFTGGAETEEALRELIAAEAQCCSFLRMELRHSGDDLLLEVSGPEDAQPIIAELFA
jgi:hypothetical protein